MLYYIVVAALMAVFPVLSIAAEGMHLGHPLSAALVGKWFVFWAVGWRLTLAGFRQMVQPGYTAREILGLQSTETHVLVRELGFANFAIGVIGILSLHEITWRTPIGLAGGIFYPSPACSTFASRTGPEPKRSHSCPISVWGRSSWWRS